MGCFTVLKSKKKKYDQPPPNYVKYQSFKEQEPMTLPEPRVHTRSLQSAPPSFKMRVNPVQPANRVVSNRFRVLSAPSTLDVAEQDVYSSMEVDDYEESRFHPSSREQRSVSPQPLPLPSPQGGSVLKAMGSFKSVPGSGSAQLYASGPLPLPVSGTLRNFLFEEISAACHNFSPDRCVSEGFSSIMYRASFGDENTGGRKFEATVTRLQTSSQGIKEFVNDANTLASLQHPNLCKLLGYHARDSSDLRALVYEKLHHGSLDRLLHGRTDGPLIDWNARMKVALCAAQGLAFLHEEGPFQAMFNEFSTANIQIDKDFSAKLSGYGCAGQIPESETSCSSVALASVSVETLERGLLTPKSNVWSFGIVLLELLTGRKNFDNRYPKEERNLVKWSRPFLTDNCRLSLIMDPQLKGRFPSEAARTMADIAQKCLQKEPSERPTMRVIVDLLKVIQDMKHACRFPLQEPAAVTGKHMSRSPSMNGIITPAPRSSLSPLPPARGPPPPPAVKVLPSLPTWIPPPQVCSSTISIGELNCKEGRRQVTEATSSIEGF
ncbi:hypothetical protein MLD38_030015 [Melastoma candidum]|uniref:Uncharacterized protein n=1 Tax=Melastoma candidum TaxID=119954 RepID=A0ACB9MKF4_9MYRT|nr:hypothetical protein MLD38_030015 [Melastoma candidum]